MVHKDSISLLNLEAKYLAHGYIAFFIRFSYSPYSKKDKTYFE